MHYFVRSNKHISQNSCVQTTDFVCKEKYQFLADLMLVRIASDLASKSVVNLT